jgi:hypothetical protein
MKSHPVAFCAYAPTNVIIQSGRGEHRTADQLEDDCDISIITHNIPSELKETYQRCQIGVKLLALVMVLLQAGNTAAQVAAHRAHTRLRLANQHIEKTCFTCKEHRNARDRETERIKNISAKAIKHSSDKIMK